MNACLKMNVFLFGSKNLSVQVLEELHSANFKIKGVLTRDHEPGMKIWHNDLNHQSLKDVATKLDLPVFEKISINSVEFQKIFSEMEIDIAIGVFWGEIIKENVLNLSKLGFFNLHTALLPRDQGSFPMAWPIINGEEYAGITFHKMASGIDDGPIVGQKRVVIDDKDTGATLYSKVTSAGIELFRELLPSIRDSTFSLKPQDASKATYHPRGYPYGGFLDPLWSKEKKERFKRALEFQPFASHKEEPSKTINKKSKPSVRAMIGFDCDRPRGSFISSEKGSKMAERKINSIERINTILEKLSIPRTYFLCGQFAESMANKYGADRIQKAFNPVSKLVELCDHSYSHKIMKKIETRHDKIPITHSLVKEEFEINTELFQSIFPAVNIEKRGFRTPLGHKDGLKGEFKLLDTLKRLEIKYVSSDLRDVNNSLHPKLITEDGKIRQPYRYENGLLEIPAIGWQDTAFSGTSSTKLFESPPKTFAEIIEYYGQLFNEGKKLSEKIGRDIFVGLVLHPYDVSFYDKENLFFEKLKEQLEKSGGTFHTYGEVSAHYHNN